MNLIHRNLGCLLQDLVEAHGLLPCGQQLLDAVIVHLLVTSVGRGESSILQGSSDTSLHAIVKRVSRCDYGSVVNFFCHRTGRQQAVNELISAEDRDGQGKKVFRGARGEVQGGGRDTR